MNSSSNQVSSHGTSSIRANLITPEYIRKLKITIRDLELSIVWCSDSQKRSVELDLRESKSELAQIERLIHDRQS